ncbi:MAG: hypothetical protein QXM37_02895 [Candidatus Bathyarchaeia archaeon]
MALKYAKNIVTETKPLPREVLESLARRGPIRSTVKIDRLIYLDREVVEGAFYMEVTLCHEGTSEDWIEEPHVHDVDEILAFIGTDFDNPKDLGAEVELWLGDELHVLTKSCLVFVPKGLKHCPVRFKRVDKPLWFMTLSPMSMYTRKAEKLTPSTAGGELKYSKYIVTEMKKGLELPPPPPGIPANASKTIRTIYLDSEVVEGAFYMECAWFSKGVGGGGPPAHIHDFDEVLGFLGSDPNNPRDLNGEVELWLGDEGYILTKSCLIFVPKGLKHCPLIIRRADKPIFHFSTGPSSKYQRQS